MPRAAKILLADPDVEAVQALARALRERGYQVLTAGDGSRALEIAVLRHPDVVLFDSACKLVAARTFLQILRTNPRTEEIPVVVTGSGKELGRLRASRDGILRKPYNSDEVLGRIAQILHRVEADRDLKTESRAIEGSLKQMGVADLLQLLGSNRRSGCLALERGEWRGEIHLAEGRPVDARIGPIGGEKAFFRLLEVKEGTFEFTPVEWTGTARIQRGMEEALLEGMRQADESTGLRTQLPGPSDRIKLVPGVALPAEQHPVTAEVVALLSEPRSLQQLLDLSQSTDYETLAALKWLLEKGLAEPAPAAEVAEGVRPLLGAAELHALRARVLRNRPASREAIGKIVILSESRRRVRAFLDRLAALPGFRLRRAPTPELLGTWAQLELPDGLRLDLYSIPGADEAQPLWQPFVAGALGGIALDRGRTTLRLIEFLRRAGVVLLAVDGPESSTQAPGSEPSDALRELLASVLRQTAA